MPQPLSTLYAQTLHALERLEFYAQKAGDSVTLELLPELSGVVGTASAKRDLLTLEDTLMGALCVGDELEAGLTK
ncbi:MAG: hypothetical protein H7095_00815 [Pseudopedobacter sp.]|nr:hypothetical protein [Deinococcales bacterium]